MKTKNLDIRNMDCMDLMCEYPDNHFDLAVVDPPYGVGVASKAGGFGSGRPSPKWKEAKLKDYKASDWDATTPPQEYFDQLFRVSKDQIIWGANYFMDKVMRASSSWIVWDKKNGTNDFADAELAFTSHKKSVRIFEGLWNGFQRCEVVDRIHPTQKPVKLYDWILANYAEKGMKILDTHLGSGSSAIACHYSGMHLTACELDEDYFKQACERIDRETSQQTFELN